MTTDRPRMGRPLVADHPTSPVTVMLTPEQHAKVRRVAAAGDQSVSAVLRALVDRLTDVPS